MSSSRGKKAVVPASKKKKGALSFSGPTAEVRHPFLRFPIGPQEELFQILWARPLIAGRCIDWAAIEQVQLAEAIRALLNTDPWELFFGIIKPTYLEITIELCSTFHLQTLSVPKFGMALSLYTDEFKEENDLHAFNRHIHRSPLRCWDALVLGGATYNPSHSSASTLSPSLRYLHAILAHTIVEQRESTGIVNTHNAYFLWCMSHGHGVIFIGPYVTRLARHFGLLSTATIESSLTLIGQMFAQGISSMLSIRMIENRRGTYPPQYRLAQTTEEKAYEDIPDDVPPQHEDPLTRPPPPSRPVHATASYADITEHLTRFEQQCFQRFDNIDATLQQICQHLYISSPVPPR
ncbi:hypothetical protein GOBAR_AA11189 [Gossypium barbadense]|uniref:Uncharacterized protein n=1 Tax=Gossypium barbadense TaxID=3634 RepID=A0A2P5Y1J1_GOSBA|nr:hypothetical protein GOBAR_AA11189 [Gossypium barbadense]